MNPVAQQQTKIKLQRTNPNPKTEERDRQIARFLFARGITTRAGFLFSRLDFSSAKLDFSSPFLLISFFIVVGPLADTTDRKIRDF